MDPISVSVGGHPEIQRVPEQHIPVEVIPDQPEVAAEIAEHVEAVQHGEIELPGPIDVGKVAGQPTSIQPSTPQQSRIVLPVNQADFTAGQKQKVSTSWRWLVEWVKRIILKYPNKAVYRS